MTRARLPEKVDPVIQEAPAVEEPVTKTYKVVGPHRVLDHEPGDEFKALLDPEQEERLVAAGHLAVRTSTASKSKKTKE